MRFEDFLDQSAVHFGTKAAIVADGRRMTYSEFEASSQRLANRLFERGVRRGDRVLVFMDNCPEAAIAIFGILKAGGVFSVINPSMKAAKLSYIIDDCEPAAILTIGRLLPVTRSALGDMTQDRRPFVLSTGIGNDEAGAEAFEAGDTALPHPVQHGGCADDLAMLVYTSGSTGRPKGVMITHANIEAAAGAITSYFGNRPDDVILNVLPLAFDYGLYQLLMSVRLGATLVLERSFAFPSAIFARMREEKVTGLPLVPTMAALILQMRDLAPNSVPSLRYITNTAAALPVDHIARLRDLFPQAALFSMYGLTECKRCTYLPPADLDRKPGSVGIAIPGTQAFVVDEAGKVAGPGVVGELVIQGPHVMQGYWRNEEATARAIRRGPDGRRALYTGDLFTSDGDGFLYFVGRKDDIIKTRGEKVAPKEVEAVLHAHPDVAEAVVAGVADPILGEAVSALVVSRNADLLPQDLISYCAKNLEDFMVPKFLRFVDSLPQTETGKVSRKLAAGLLEAAR